MPIYAITGESLMHYCNPEQAPVGAVEMKEARPEQTGINEIVAQADGTWGEKVYTDAEQDTRRAEQYKLRVDPLINESTVKSAAGDTVGADEAVAAAVAERTLIQSEYPKGAV